MKEQIILKMVNTFGHVLTFNPAVPLLNNKIINGAQQPIAAIYKLELLGSAGTAILYLPLSQNSLSEFPGKIGLSRLEKHLMN